MNILLPTDFSENAVTARQFALDLHSKSPGKLIFLHSYDLPTPDRSISTSLVDVMRENAEENMKDFIKSISDNRNLQTEVLMGNPIRLAKETVEKHEIDIIVMGTKGSSGLEEFLIGSNASAVIHHVDIPVLVIPPNASQKPIKKIILATDMDSKILDRPLARLKRFAEINNASVEILHIQDKNGNTSGSRDKIKSALGETVHSYTIIKADDKEEAIISFGKEKNAEVICTITRRYSFFEGIFHKSLTSKLAYHSAIPLLALHQGD